MRRCRLAFIYSWACVITSFSAVAQSPAPPSAPDRPLQEVTVDAKRLLGHKALARAVSGFVASHSATSTRINQIGRWRYPVCPLVTGLQDSARNFVTTEILDIARGVGAPTKAAGKKCDVNVEIVFTKQPQALLDHIAKSYRVLLGYYPKSQVAQAMKFSRPIQAWYESGIRSAGGYQAPIPGMGNSGAAAATQPASASGATGDVPFFVGLQLESDATAMGTLPSGTASRFGGGLRSEFVHVLIIADSGQVGQYPIKSIADYVALLSLTRMTQLDGCAPLPSITDLLADGCTASAGETLSSVDRAYLKALYSSDLEKTES